MHLVDTVFTRFHSSVLVTPPSILSLDETYESNFLHITQIFQTPIQQDLTLLQYSYFRQLPVKSTELFMRENERIKDLDETYHSKFQILT